MIGLGLYALVMARFDFAQLRVARGDHWVTGRALAICALAAALITLAASRQPPARARRPAPDPEGGHRRAVVAITTFARVWVWAGVALWGVLFAGMLRRAYRVVRGEPPPSKD